MDILKILLLLAVTLIPGYAVFKGNYQNKKWVKPLLSLSGSFLLALSFCHLLPEAYHSIGSTTGIYVLAGFFLQVFLESMTKGVEHGHSHAHGQFSKYFPLLAIGGLTIHSIMEALPLGGGIHDHHHSYLTGIAMHKFPIALTLASILHNTPISLGKKWLWFLIFAISAPGILAIHPLLPEEMLSEEMLAGFSALAVGIFLHVSTTILFEMEDGHRLKPAKLGAIVLGLAIYFLTQ